MRRTWITVLLIPLMLSCGGPEPFDHGVDLGVDLPEFRIPGSDRLAEEPWVAHVAVLDEGVKVRLEYQPADGGPRERMLAAGEDLPWPADLEGEPPPEKIRPPEKTICRRVAIVLHASPDQPIHPTLRRLPVEPGFRIPRLYLAGAGGRTVPVVVPHPWAEIEINRLGHALQIWDLTQGLVTEAATILRVTRSGDRVRYRWQRVEDWKAETPWSGGDVTLDGGDLHSDETGPLLPSLARFLEPRHVFENGLSTAVVQVDLGEDARIIDFLRAVECARGDPRVLFYLCPDPWRWGAGPDHVYSIRIPRSERHLAPETWSYVSPQDRERACHLSLTVDGRSGDYTRPLPPADLREKVEQYSRFERRRVTGRIVLRFDERARWASARPWAVRASATGIELALRFQHGDRWLDSESELRLPVEPEGECLSMMAAEVAERAAEAKGWVVVLSAPDSATVNDVWQAALAVIDAGAAGVVFE